VAGFLAAPHRTQSFSNISKSGRRMQVCLCHCQTSSSQHSEDTLGTSHASANVCASYFSPSIGLHWRFLSARLDCVYIHPSSEASSIPNCPIRNVAHSLPTTTFSPTTTIARLRPALPLHCAPRCASHSSFARVIDLRTTSLHPRHPSRLLRRPSKHLPSLQAGQLRDSASLALGVSGTRTTL
jgi:hypothetical protein